MPQGHVFVWSVTQPRVYLDCHIAGITEINVGSVDGKPTRWLESGILKKSDGKWRVEFFNSARTAETPLTPAPGEMMWAKAGRADSATSTRACLSTSTAPEW